MPVCRDSLTNFVQGSRAKASSEFLTPSIRRTPRAVNAANPAHQHWSPVFGEKLGLVSRQAKAGQNQACSVYDFEECSHATCRHQAVCMLAILDLQAESQESQNVRLILLSEAGIADTAFVADA